MTTDPKIAADIHSKLSGEEMVVIRRRDLDKKLADAGHAPDDFNAWMRTGIEAGWCGPPVCSTHDGTPISEAEDEQMEVGHDPCIHIVRMYESADVKAAVEENHAPSKWRDSYTKK